MSGSAAEPLVSIGIPTYRRVETLRRSIESALAQSHRRIEVIVCDDGSGDGTQALCRELAARDARLRYLGHDVNRGSTESFNELFAACRGEYAMMLADDDWIDSDYVARCLAALRGGEGLVLAGGRPEYVRGSTFVSDGTLHSHRQRSLEQRVRDYLRTVDENGIMYGLMPREVMDRAAPLPNVLGNDWLWVARIAAQGPVETLEEVRVHRELGGTSVNIESIVRIFGLSRWQARVPQFVIASELFADIAWRSSVYEALGPRRRWMLALQGALASMRWRALVWHLLTPAVRRISGARDGHPVWRAYERLTRALGAGRRP